MPSIRFDDIALLCFVLRHVYRLIAMPTVKRGTVIQ